MLEVRGLNVWYGITEVIRDVSLAVAAGEIVALLGGNGSGKTTILNTLSGLVAPRAGRIALDGSDLTGRRCDRVVRAGMVQVPQGREVFATMSVAENLELGAATRRDMASVRQDVEEMLETFPALGERRNRRAGSLSGGEQQQLAIARALMARPRVLLMDEPSAGLSPVIAERMTDSIRMLNERGLTILLVEQNVGVAAAVATRAYVLRDGEIAHTGPMQALVDSQELLASYLGN